MLMTPPETGTRGAGDATFGRGSTARDAGDERRFYTARSSRYGMGMRHKVAEDVGVWRDAPCTRCTRGLRLPREGKRSRECMLHGIRASGTMRERVGPMVVGWWKIAEREAYITLVVEPRVVYCEGR